MPPRTPKRASGMVPLATLAPLRLVTAEPSPENAVAEHVPFMFAPADETVSSPADVMVPVPVVEILPEVVIVPVDVTLLKVPVDVIAERLPVVTTVPLASGSVTVRVAVGSVTASVSRFASTVAPSNTSGAAPRSVPSMLMPSPALLPRVIVLFAAPDAKLTSPATVRPVKVPTLVSDDDVTPLERVVPVSALAASATPLAVPALEMLQFAELIATVFAPPPIATAPVVVPVATLVVLAPALELIEKAVLLSAAGRSDATIAETSHAAPVPRKYDPEAGAVTFRPVPPFANPTIPVRFDALKPVNPAALPLNVPLKVPLNAPLVVPARVRSEASASETLPPSVTEPPPLNPVPAVTVNDELAS